jgi:hypothetical protein
METLLATPRISSTGLGIRMLGPTYQYLLDLVSDLLRRPHGRMSWRITGRPGIATQDLPLDELTNTRQQNHASGFPQRRRTAPSWICAAMAGALF